jgi:hypothetical protein
MDGKAIESVKEPRLDPGIPSAIAAVLPALSSRCNQAARVASAL